MKVLNISKKEYPSKEILLDKGDKEVYFIDKRQKHIAITKRDKRIYVNEAFLRLSNKKKRIVIYHERGHSKFILWKFCFEFANSLLLLSLISIIFPLFILLLNLLFKITMFKISNLIWIFFVILGISLFINHVLINWLLEILADANAIKFINKKDVISTIDNIYKEKKKNFWGDNIFHPPWKLRKKIMEKLD